MELFLAWEGGVVHSRAGGAELVFGDYLHDFFGVQLGHPTSVVEGEVVVFEAFDSAGRARV